MLVPDVFVFYFRDVLYRDHAHSGFTGAAVTKLRYGVARSINSTAASKVLLLLFITADTGFILSAKAYSPLRLFEMPIVVLYNYGIGCLGLELNLGLLALGQSKTQSITPLCFLFGYGEVLFFKILNALLFGPITQPGLVYWLLHHINHGLIGETVTLDRINGIFYIIRFLISSLLAYHSSFDWEWA